MAASPADDEARDWLSESLWELARVLRALGQTRTAEESDADREGLWKTQSPAKLAALALRETEKAAMIGYGKIPLTESGRAVRERDLNQAAANLKLAISLGFNDLATLRKDPNAWALLERADLQPLLKGLEPSPLSRPLQPR